MLERIADWIVYSLAGLDHSARWAESLSFFISDSIKIVVLLFLMILVMGFLRTYVPQGKVRKWMSNKRAYIGNIVASCIGAVTPFCSCSSIPIFLSFLEAGVPLGITFSFLITSPLVNEYLVVLMLVYFGWKITAAYVMTGIVIGVIAGIILGKMRLEKHLVKDLVSSSKYARKEVKYSTIMSRIRFGLSEAVSITRKVGLWILVGVAIGAVIHNYVPSEIIQSIIGKAGLLAVPVAVIIGIPMYGSCAAIVPVAVALFNKGVPLGTALAFMMAIAALSLPEAVILRRVMNLKLIAIFFGIVALGIILIGYLYNMLQTLLV